MQNKLSHRFYPLLLLILSVALVLLSIRAASPPKAVGQQAADTVFSAERAYKYLQQIARAPHSVGTLEHERVKNYIVTACAQLGLPVEIQNTTVLRKENNMLLAANIYNIVAVIKGSKPGNAILNSAHYDSQPNTPGAADDGIGVVAMLEAARAVKASSSLQNDVIFLFTDGEEEGLLGAKAFIEQDSLFKNVKVAMNWDSRGNKGISLTYETSPDNGWLIKQYAKGEKYPAANSMGYEISKRLPNDADFTYFLKAGVTGFANGLIEGYSNYHTMNDSPEKLDQGSLQQVGDNMLGMIKQLGNTSLNKTTAPDVSYFNLYGYGFIYYPSSLNIFFIIAASVLFVFVFIKGIQLKKIRITGFVLSLVALPVTLAATYFISKFVLQKILNHYPLYSHFYENNSYNSGWYFLAMSMLSLLIFSLIYEPITRKWGVLSSFAGVLSVTVAAIWAAYLYVPSASWLLSFPAIFLLAGYAWTLYSKKENLHRNSRDYLIRFVSIIPTILLFAPLTYFIFLSFGLGNNLPIAAALVAFAGALCYPVAGNIFKSHRWLFPSLCLGFLFFSLFMAQGKSAFNKTHPLQANVSYRLNATDSSAVWLSDYRTTDKFSSRFFPDKKIDSSIKNRKRLIHFAPAIAYAPPNAVIQKDTAYGNVRELTILFNSTRNGVNTMGILFDESTVTSLVNIEINDKRNKPESSDSQPVSSVLFYGIPKQGFIMKILIKINTKLNFELFDRSPGLPPIKNLTEYPADIIPGTDFTSNTVQVEKHFIL